MNKPFEFQDLTEDARKKSDEDEKIASRGDGWDSPGVSELGAERAQEDEDAATAAGFSVAPPIYEIGSLVNKTGVNNFRASREEYEDMPSASEACEKLITQIKEEKREDKLVPVTGLNMLDDGRLHNDDNGTYPLTSRALTGLCSRVTPGGGGYLRHCPPALRARNLNHWFTKGTSVDVRASKEAIKTWDKTCEMLRQNHMDLLPRPVQVETSNEVTLRTRLNHASGNREVFSVVGPRYGEYDIDKIAAQIVAGVPGESRADITYDGYRTRIDVLFHSDVQPERVVAGEIFKAGIMAKTADDGTGSIQIAAQVWRNLCLNLYIIDNAQDLVMRRSHRGSSISDAVEVGIQAALAKVQYFADRWSQATVDKCIEKFGYDSEECLRRLVANKVVHVPAVRPFVMLQRLRDAFAKEPGDTPTAVLNAVTRVAHECVWPKWTDVEDLERLGGQLLFADRWELDVKEGEFERLQLTLDQ